MRRPKILGKAFFIGFLATTIPALAWYVATRGWTATATVLQTGIVAFGAAGFYYFGGRKHRLKVARQVR